jgi:hypothetical protein
VEAIHPSRPPASSSSTPCLWPPSVRLLKVRPQAMAHWSHADSHAMSLQRTAAKGLTQYTQCHCARQSVAMTKTHHVPEAESSDDKASIPAGSRIASGLIQVAKCLFCPSTMPRHDPMIRDIYMVARSHAPCKLLPPRHKEDSLRANGTYGEGKILL